MAFRLTSGLFCLCLLTSAVQGQAFGRFGYTETPRQGGILIDRGGFVAEHAAADRFGFSRSSRMWRALTTTAFGQTILMSGGSRLPVKARLNLLSAGPEFYFESGMRLDLGSTGAPYVTWSDGSAGADIPTPDVSWVLVSFKNAQPPVLLAFLDGKASVSLSGRPGDWHLVTEKPYRGWMRVVLPFGSEGIAAGGAAGLGHQSQRLAKSIESWLRPAPQAIGFAVKGDSDSVSATWSFDRPGALVPASAVLAPAGGYKLVIASKITMLDGETPEGPREAVVGNTLSIGFPIRRIPNGRTLGVGPALLDAPGTVSPVDVPSVAELALGCLVSGRETAYKKMGEDTLANYLTDAEYLPEPSTAQSLPYRADGQGLDLVAAQALLMQALSLSTKTSSDENSLLTSLAWRRDWCTWRFELAGEIYARRASAIGAVAGACCPEPSRRLDAAMLEAGLAAQRALDAKLAKAGTPPTARIEPLCALRARIFGDVSGGDPFSASLLSPLRVFGDQPFTLEKSGKNLVLVWTAGDVKPLVITLVSSYSLRFENGNLKALDVSSALGTYSLKAVPKEAGRCEVRVILPSWAPPLPAATLPPAYSDLALPANPR